MSRLVNLKKKINELENKKFNKNIEIKKCWVTFETIEMRNYAMYLFGRDSIRNFLWNVFGTCCLDKEILVFRDSMLIADPAPDPSNI